MIKRAYAKLNLCLNVLSKRTDGYHELEMIMVPISLYDQIKIEKIDQGIELTSSNQHLPTTDKNSMVKAAHLMFERFNISGGIKIDIKKMIPIQAGLAGGSTDAAAVIKAINELYDLKLSLEQLASIGKEIGADVPFCIYQQSAIVKGIGEQITPFTHQFNGHILLIKPRIGVSTKKVFTHFEIGKEEHANVEMMKEALQANDILNVSKHLKNHLESATIKEVPIIQTIKDELHQMGFEGCLMSGSGTTVFGITNDKEKIEKAYKHFRKKSCFVFECKIIT